MRIEFDSFIAERTRDFSPRPWIFRRIAEWLSDPAAPRFFLITGEPGSGKTAIVAWLCELSSGTASNEDEAAPRLIGSITAHHFCVAQDSHWLDPVRFSESISTQIADRVPRFRETVLAQLREQRPMEIHAHIDVAQNWGNVIAVNISAALTAGEAFSRVVRTPLEAIYATSFDGPIVIAVDALDEARHASAATNIFHLVARTRYLPPQVRFILTSRPASEILRELEQQEPRLLHVSLGDPSTREETFADVRRYVEGVVAARPELVTRRVPQLTADALIERICRKSDGNFLWARYALLTLQSGGADVDDAAVSALPPGLDRLYAEFLHRVVEGSRSRWRDELGPILGLLAVSQDELTEAEIASLTSLPRDIVAQDLTLVSELLDSTPAAGGDRYSIFHRSFVDFLITASTAHEYWCDAAAQHRRIVTRWREHGRGIFRQSSDYELRNIARHLYELHDDDEATCDLAALVSHEWMEIKRSRLGSDASFFTDVELALESARRRRPAAVAEEVRASLVLATLGSRGERLGAAVTSLMTRLGRLDEALQEIRMMPLPLRWRAYVAVSKALVTAGDPDRAIEMAREALATAPAENERSEARAALVAALAHAGRLDEAFAMSHQLDSRGWSVVGDLRDRAVIASRMDIALPLTAEISDSRDSGSAQLFAVLDAHDPKAAADMLRSIESRPVRVMAVALAMERGEVREVAERYKDVIDADEFDEAIKLVSRMTKPAEPPVGQPEAKRSFEEALKRGDVAGASRFHSEVLGRLTPAQQLAWVRLLIAADDLDRALEVIRSAHDHGGAHLLVIEALARKGDVPMEMVDDIETSLKPRAIAHLCFGAAIHSAEALESLDLRRLGIGGAHVEHELALILIEHPTSAKTVIENLGKKRAAFFPHLVYALFDLGAADIAEALLIAGPETALQSMGFGILDDWDILHPVIDRLQAALERRLDADVLPRSAAFAARNGDVAGARAAIERIGPSWNTRDLIDVLLARVALGERERDESPRLLQGLTTQGLYLRPAVNALAAAGYEEAVRRIVKQREREIWIVDGMIVAGRKNDALAILDEIDTADADEIAWRYARLVPPDELPRRLERFRNVAWHRVLDGLCWLGLVAHAAALVPLVEDADGRELEKLTTRRDIDPHALAALALATATPRLRAELFAAALRVAARRGLVDEVINATRNAVDENRFQDLLAAISCDLDDVPEASAVVELQRGSARDMDRLFFALCMMTGLGQHERALRLAMQADLESHRTMVPIVLAAIAPRTTLERLLAFARETGEEWPFILGQAAEDVAAGGDPDLAAQIAIALEETPYIIHNVVVTLAYRGEVERARSLAAKCEDELERQRMLAVVAAAFIRRGSFDAAIETVNSIPEWVRAGAIVTAAQVFIEIGESDRAIALCEDLIDIRDMSQAAAIGELFLDAADETHAREVLDLILLDAGSSHDDWGASSVLESACGHLAAAGNVAMATQLADRFRCSNRCARGLQGMIHALESRGDLTGAAQIASTALDQVLLLPPGEGTSLIIETAGAAARCSGFRALSRIIDRIVESRDADHALEILAHLANELKPLKTPNNIRDWIARFARRWSANALTRRALKIAETFSGAERLNAMLSLITPLIDGGRGLEAARIANALSAERHHCSAEVWNQTVLPRLGRAFAAAGESNRARHVLRELLDNGRSKSDRHITRIGRLLSEVGDDTLCEETVEHIVTVDSGFFAPECAQPVAGKPAIAASLARAFRKHAQEFSSARPQLAEALLWCGVAAGDSETVDAARALIEDASANDQLRILSGGALLLSGASIFRAREWAGAARVLAIDPEISIPARAEAHARLANAFRAIGDTAAAEDALWRTIDALRHLSRHDWFRVFEFAQPSFATFGGNRMTDIYLAITDVETWSDA